MKQILSGPIKLSQITGLVFEAKFFDMLSVKKIYTVCKIGKSMSLILSKGLKWLDVTAMERKGKYIYSNWRVRKDRLKDYFYMDPLLDSSFFSGNLILLNLMVISFRECCNSHIL